MRSNQTPSQKKKTTTTIKPKKQVCRFLTQVFFQPVTINQDH